MYYVIYCKILHTVIIKKEDKYYLSDNKSHWLISNDTIIFDSKEKLNEFGILLSKIEGNNEYINQKDITKQDKTL